MMIMIIRRVSDILINVCGVSLGAFAVSSSCLRTDDTWTSDDVACCMPHLA
jgi:hypothetical protein